MTRYDANPVEEIGVIPLPSGFQPRGETPPLPTPLDNWLNKAQMLSLRTMEYFGWELWFVRRQQAPTVVVIRDLQRAIRGVRARRPNQPRAND